MESQMLILFQNCSSKSLLSYPHRTSDAVLESENDPHDHKNGRRPDSILVLIRESFLDRKDPESVSPQNGWVSGFCHGRGPLSPSIFITLAPYVCICKLSRQAARVES